MTHFRAGRVLIATAAVAALATACSPGSDGSGRPVPSGSAPSGAPGRVSVRAPGVDLTITDAVVHVLPSGAGTLTMTVHHGDGVPEHLAMVAAPGGGRGTLTGAPKGSDGMLTTAGILLPADSTVTFGRAKGPAVTLEKVPDAASAHTLPLLLEFGVARLVRLSAVVSTH